MADFLRKEFKHCPSLLDLIKQGLAKLRRDKPLIIFGHSVGGAIAAPVAFLGQLIGFSDIQVYTLGAFKVLNRKGADALARIVKVHYNFKSRGILSQQCWTLPRHS